MPEKSRVWMDERDKFHNEKLNSMLTNQTNFKVISVIGRQGSGKTSMMNALAKEKVFSQSKTKDFSIFPTKGRFILVDTPPLLALCHDKRRRGDDIQTQLVDSYMKQIKKYLFVLSSSETVIILQDRVSDPMLWTFIELLLILKQGISINPFSGKSNHSNSIEEETFFPRISKKR
jgi:GTP-binding protein EngB required for normal cell division